jgi:hypothetical protein
MPTIRDSENGPDCNTFKLSRVVVPRHGNRSNSSEFSARMLTRALQS